MKLVVFVFVSVIILPIVISAFELSLNPTAEVNLTHWREHRRKKRFIVYANSGGIKMGAGIGWGIDVGDMRQLSMSYGMQAQYLLPGKPYYWWNKWNKRNMADEKSTLNIPDFIKNYRDDAQEFIYDFAENLMERNGMNGRACLQKMICENAQIQAHQGMFSEILYRILQPQRNLNSDYTEAWLLGKKFINCNAVYFKANKCLLDDYLHVRKDFQMQNIVKDLNT